VTTITRFSPGRVLTLHLDAAAAAAAADDDDAQ